MPSCQCFPPEITISMGSTDASVLSSPRPHMGGMNWAQQKPTTLSVHMWICSWDWGWLLWENACREMKHFTAKVKCYLRLFFSSTVTAPLTGRSLKDSSREKDFFKNYQNSLILVVGKNPHAHLAEDKHLLTQVRFGCPGFQGGRCFAIPRVSSSQRKCFGACPWKAATPDGCLETSRTFMC